MCFDLVVQIFFPCKTAWLKMKHKLSTILLFCRTASPSPLPWQEAAALPRVPGVVFSSKGE